MVQYLPLATRDRCHRCGRAQFNFRRGHISGPAGPQPLICNVCLDAMLVRGVVRCMQHWGLERFIMLVLKCFPSYLHGHRMTYRKLFLDGGLPYDIPRSLDASTEAYLNAYAYSPFFAIDQEYVRVKMAPRWRSGRSYRPGCSDVESLTTHVLSFLSGATVAAQTQRCKCRGARRRRRKRRRREAWCARCILRRALTVY